MIIVQSSKSAHPGRNYLRKTLLSALAVFALSLLLSLTMTSCDDGGDSGPKPSASVIPRSTDEYRVRFVAFSIVGNGDYRLALRKNEETAPTAEETAPTANEIRASSATIVRTLSATPINVYMAFHMDTDIFDATTDWEHADYKQANFLLKSAKVIPAMLEAGTEYTLYGTAATGDTVLTLATFTTDPDPDLESAFYNVPLGDNTYTIRKDEPFLLPSTVRTTTTVGSRNGSVLIATISNITESVIVPGGVSFTHFFDILNEGDGEQDTVGLIDKGLTVPPENMDSDNGFSFYFRHHTSNSPAIKFVYQE